MGSNASRNEPAHLPDFPASDCRTRSIARGVYSARRQFRRAPYGRIRCDIGSSASNLAEKQDFFHLPEWRLSEIRTAARAMGALQVAHADERRPQPRGDFHSLSKPRLTYGLPFWLWRPGGEIHRPEIKHLTNLPARPCLFPYRRLLRRGEDERLEEIARALCDKSDCGSHSGQCLLAYTSPDGRIFPLLPVMMTSAASNCAQTGVKVLPDYPAISWRRRSLSIIYFNIPRQEYIRVLSWPQRRDNGLQAIRDVSIRYKSRVMAYQTRQREPLITPPPAEAIEKPARNCLASFCLLG